MNITPGQKNELAIRVIDGQLKICAPNGMPLENILGFQLASHRGELSLVVQVMPVVLTDDPELNSILMESNIVLSMNDMLNVIRSQGFLVYNPQEKHG